MHKFQMSVRELMLVVFLVALGIVGASTGGWIASLTVLVFVAVMTVFTIVAFVGHGQRRAFAIGYLIPFFIYVLPHVYVGSSELDPYGKLPTTKLLQPVFELLVRREYINMSTGQPVPNYDPTANPGLGSGGLGGGGFGTSVSIKETPDRTTFMLLAHLLFASVLAYAGGKIAIWVNYHDTA